VSAPSKFASGLDLVPRLDTRFHLTKFGSGQGNRVCIDQKLLVWLGADGFSGIS
jgi:hypothetical protein